MDTALGHLRVLDLSNEKSAFAGRYFAEFGADVIKIEPPGGSSERARPPFKDHTPHPEGSLQFLYFNRGKRSIVLDLERSEADRATFRDLVKSADVIVENYAPGHLAELGLGYEDLSRINPGIVVASVTPFGQTGPYAQWKGDDLVAHSMGGVTYIAGVAGEEPSAPPSEMGYQMAAMHAVYGALIALYNRWKTGRGDHVDVSMQEVAAHEFFTMVRYSAESTIVGRTGAMASQPANTVYEAKDGLVRISIFEAAHYRALTKDWIGDEEISSPEFEIREIRMAAGDLINERINAWTRQHTVEELIEGALERRIPMAPLSTPADFIESPYARYRGLFAEEEHPYIGTYPVSKPYLIFTETPPKTHRPAPLLNADEAAIRAEIAARKDWKPAPAAHFDPGTARTPFEGIRVLDFTRVWAGPFGTRFLADHGAEVIKVESNKRPDQRPQPGVPAAMALNSNAMYADRNRNKLDIAVDLGSEQGQEMIRQLAAKCDLVVENHAPGVMDRLGIGYEALKQVNPDIILISAPGFGEGTPHSHFPAYGGTLMCYAGMSYMWGLADSEPRERCQLAYPDFITSTHIPVVATTALHYRSISGKGQYVEIPQIDAASAFMGVTFLDQNINGSNPEPIGNQGYGVAPHGVYRCKGWDGWVSIAVTTEDEWRALIAAVEQPNWGEDPRFATMADRVANRAALDALIGEWTSIRTPMQCTRILQAHGVPAGAVQDGEMLYHDLHLRAREYVLDLDHPGIGRFQQPGFTMRLSHETVDMMSRPAPELGADTKDVFTRVVGLSEAEVDRLIQEQVLY